MAYYFNKTISGMDFDSVIEKVTEALSGEGFGVLSDIDVSATLKKKLDVDFRKYRILGACNPGFAHKALQSEDRIGVFLPCNVIVQQREDDQVEVAAVDPIASMMAVENETLGEVAAEVQQRLRKVIDSL